MRWLDRYWDEAAGLVRRPLDPGEPVVTQHLIRSTAWYALGLLLRDGHGDRERALDAIGTVLDYQYDQPGRPHHGTFLRSPTEAINSEFVSVHYFDMGLGALYNASTNGNNNYYFGVSAYHLNHPKVSFLGEDTINVPTRLTFHGGGFFPYHLGRFDQGARGGTGIGLKLSVK